LFCSWGERKEGKQEGVAEFVVQSLFLRHLVANWDDLLRDLATGSDFSQHLCDCARSQPAHAADITDTITFNSVAFSDDVLGQNWAQAQAVEAPVRRIEVVTSSGGGTVWAEVGVCESSTIREAITNTVGPVAAGGDVTELTLYSSTVADLLQDLGSNAPIAEDWNADVRNALSFNSVSFPDDSPSNTRVQREAVEAPVAAVVLVSCRCEGAVRAQQRVDARVERLVTRNQFVGPSTGVVAVNNCNVRLL